MFDIVKEFIDEFWAYMPTLTVICIVLAMLGYMAFRGRQ